MARVSVVIPTFNRRQMVSEAVQSVLDQTLNDVEIVVVDDGSTDGTGQFLQERFDQRIKYLDQEKHGRSVARNRGVLSSTSPYILFLDSDDLLLPDGLEVMSRFLDEHLSTDVVFADGYYCMERGEIIEPVSGGRPPVDPDRILETLVLQNIIAAPHLAMVRRESLEKLGYPFFDERLFGYEDADLWIRLAEQGNVFRPLDVMVGKYRLHGSGNESSPVSPNRPRREESRLRFKQKIYHASYFQQLSVATRKQFLRDFLLVLLRGNVDSQEIVLNESQFQSLPAKDRADLLYFVGTENIIENGQVEVGRRQLSKAIALDRTKKRFQLTFSLSYLGRSTLRLILKIRRRAHALKHGKGYVAPHWR
jgi:glycosyltransferase involved in cell wall biosynthesis